MESTEAIEQSFRQLVAEKHFRSISVKEICERAHVSRKTFYVYFEGKDDVIEQIFRRDVVSPVHSLAQMLSNEEMHQMSQSLMERIFSAVRKDAEYYRALVAPMFGTDFTFKRISTQVFVELCQAALSRLQAEENEMYRRYVAYYFGSALASLIERWICDDFVLPEERLALIYSRVAGQYWSELLSR